MKGRGAHLVGNAENKAGGVRNDVHNVRHSNDILGETEAAEIRVVKKPHGSVQGL